MIDILLAPLGFVISSPLLAYMAYRLWRERLAFALAVPRGLKCLGSFLIFAVILNASIFAGRLAYIMLNACDYIDTFPPATNSRGDAARGQLEACKIMGSVENYSVILQVHTGWHFWSSKTLIDYSPKDYSDPKLRWLDDDTLSVDLGEVSWVSRQLDQVGDVHIRYSYILNDPDRRGK